ncbi:hypothetical protein EET67_11925 [Pseudaminobacter arsenicus]|uniref:Uncharacterized protein n=1 Tax=Borborobacter arsenicus TaxID=1851146 RepID=A0A432V6J1_9HYPH|nr:hypothetical protein [Pseudaminobacter arsenicus]RUM97765.1 hypothetical protein EET67_11925 [Pseudaminobacter arsenicus]
MNPEEQWNLVRGERATRFESAGMGALRITLLFGSAVIALALLATPVLDMRTRPHAGSVAGLDMMSTGSTHRGEVYTIRRSVLQPNPDAVCIIRSNGQRSGEC